MRTLLLVALCVGSLAAQVTIGFDDSPYSLNVAAQAPLGAYSQTATGLRSTEGLIYSTETPQLIAISPDGMLTGLLPGEASVTVTETVSQQSAVWTLNVVPARIVLTPASADLVVGESVNLTAEAFDSLNRLIPGLVFRFSAAFGQLVRIDGSKATAIAPGQTFITAQLEGLQRGGGTFASASFRVNPKPLYTTRPLLSAATAVAASPVSFSKVVASNNRTAVIAGFDNGGQAAVLLDGATQKVLVAAGQGWGENGSVVLKLNSISINKAGDVAVMVEMSDFWCSSSILLFQQKGTTVEIPTGCNGLMGPKSLGQDGSIIYYSDSAPQSIVKRAANGDLTTLLQRNTTVAGLGKVRDFQQMTPSSDGTVLAQLTPENGLAFFAIYDGAKWIRAFAFGDLVGGEIVNNADGFVSNAAGQWYFRAFGNGFGAVMSMDLTGKPKFFLKQQEPATSDAKLGWPHRLLDADGTNLLMMAGLNVSDKYNDWLCWVKSSSTIQPIQPSHWDAVRDGAVSASGAVMPLVADNLLKLQKWTTTAETVLSASARMLVPSAAEWRYLKMNNRDAWIHGADDGFFRSSDNRPVLIPGQKLPTQQSLVMSGLSAAHPNGWTLFSGISQNSQGVYLNGNGRTTMLADSALNTPDTLGRRVDWLEWGAQSFRMSVNSRGDAAYGGSFGSTFGFVLQKQGELLPRMLMSNATLLPGGAGTSGWIPRIDLDDAGELRFLTYPNSGGAGIYQTNGTTIKTLLSTREPFDGGPAQNIYAYCSRNGNALAAVDATTRGTLFALSTGGGFTPVDFGLPERGGLPMNGMPGGFCDVSMTGDIFFVAQTPEGRTGIFHYSAASRRTRVVFYLGQKLGDGATLLQPYQIAAGPNGTFFFAAHVYGKQTNYLAVYEAIPQP